MNQLQAGRLPCQFHIRDQQVGIEAALTDLIPNGSGLVERSHVIPSHDQNLFYEHGKILLFLNKDDQTHNLALLSKYVIRRIAAISP
ncbi:hypothetical protein EWW49_25960 [Pseudomonas syringae]|uniref:hypothetical protein n=1 Tax=Pseudomonas sp. MWU16-30316 TaxID=2878093 RepID=UPI0011050A2A|nr:hypothetical protein [Pseudomonas sp. MWU16-30316]TFZ34275.1 hypothetical protein EWW49_25960 [Pseudomonas syringae]